LMDIGMLVLDQVLTDQYSELHARTKTHNELAAVEKAVLGMTHAQVGGMLTEEWKLPPLRAIPVMHHHSSDQVTDPPLRKLAELIWLSSRCADVFVDDEAAPAIADVRRALEQQYKLTETDGDQLLAEICGRTKEVASLFEINIGSSAEYDAILEQANETLVSITLQSQMQASALEQQNQKLKEQAETDGLTGLANRARFDQFAADAFALAVKHGQAMSVLTLDLDRFKHVNDSFGHAAGDQVLRAIGKVLKSIARPQDLAARYGGEEFVLVLPGTPRATAAAIAETLRRAVASRPVQNGEVTIPVTVSIGVSCYETAAPFTDLAQLLKASDLALYNAKKSGRNCVRVFSLKPGGAKKPAGSSGNAAA